MFFSFLADLDHDEIFISDDDDDDDNDNDNNDIENPQQKNTGKKFFNNNLTF